ncbi:hypothetical protein DEU38_103207 [Rhodococcus sp. AG1013]|nr:hypothetical protein DEU38_103207 [Rhodococcus sp. AG1013]
MTSASTGSTSLRRSDPVVPHRYCPVTWLPGSRPQRTPRVTLGASVVSRPAGKLQFPPHPVERLTHGGVVWVVALGADRGGLDGVHTSFDAHAGRLVPNNGAGSAPAPTTNTSSTSPPTRSGSTGSTSRQLPRPPVGTSPGFAPETHYIDVIWRNDCRRVREGLRWHRPCYRLSDNRWPSRWFRAGLQQCRQDLPPASPPAPGSHDVGARTDRACKHLDASQGSSPHVDG